jgi:hypothetical protein
MNNHQMRVDLGLIWFLAKVVEQNNESFPLERLQQISAGICENVEENWKRWGLQRHQRFDQDIADLLAVNDYDHEIRGLLKKPSVSR